MLQSIIPFVPRQPEHLIHYSHRILLLGSCFTEHIGSRFRQLGWDVCENPNGIIFNPDSIYRSVHRLIANEKIDQSALILNNELYHHWDFHSRFSHTDPQTAVQEINASIEKGHGSILHADRIIITLGSSYQYFYSENNYGVTNCHRVPANRFQKRMLTIAETEERLRAIILETKQINPSVEFIFTISPVRHIKDGVVENNRSKARLIEAVHSICEEYGTDYFPAYEIMIDVLRDYRYYDIDLVHPNYAATQYVWEQLMHSHFNDDTKEYVRKMIDLNDAFNHRTRFPDTNAHKKFLETYAAKCRELEERYPHLDLGKYKDHFTIK